LADTVGALVCLAPASTRCRRARHAAWGASPVGGHGDVLGGHRGPCGGSPWTVTGPFFDYCSISICSLVMLDSWNLVTNALAGPCCLLLCGYLVRRLFHLTKHLYKAVTAVLLIPSRCLNLELEQWSYRAEPRSLGSKNH
jgi:hypothetical protein